MGIDLAKNVFRVHGCDARGKVVVRKSLTRRQSPEFVAKLSPCLVGMEARAHYWAREIQKFGHQVRLTSPKFVQPYVKNNQIDSRDSEAICEAVQRPTMRFVAVKSPAQQDIQAFAPCAPSASQGANGAEQSSARPARRIRATILRGWRR